MRARAGFALACAVALSACSADERIGPSRFAARTIDSVFIGRSFDVVTLSTFDGSVITASPQEWSSSDTNIAIAIGGRVYATGHGTAEISAVLDGHKNATRVRSVPMWLNGGVAFANASVGYWENCALTAAGAPVCRPRTVPDSTRAFMPVDGAPPLAELHVAERHQCGLTPDGAMYCRGANSRGQFGTGSTSAAASGAFVAAGSGHRFAAISTGGSGANGHTCGIRVSDSLVYCAGWNDVGQSGQDPARTLDSVLTPLPQLRARGVAAGRRHTCAIAVDGQAYCWGLNLLGVLGQPRAGVNFTGTPQLVSGGLTFTQLSADGHTCGITPTRELYCWGSNAGGQLGVGTRENLEHAAPARVPLEEPVASVTTANGYTCAITVAGALYCWGLYPASVEDIERLGDRRYSPVHLARGIRFRSVTVSAENVCGVTDDSRLMCL